VPQTPKNRDPLDLEVERLLRKLPGADPTLRGTPEPIARPAGVTTGPRPALPADGRQAPPLSPAVLWGLAGRIALAAALGVALTQWPYAAACGWPLLGYLAAVLAFLFAAGWAAVSAWRWHVGIAHAAALVVFFWGIVLAAEQVLPRVGYAAESASWRCESSSPPARRPVSPTPSP
jgi:hypothetical protein